MWSPALHSDVMNYLQSDHPDTILWKATHHYLFIVNSKCIVMCIVYNDDCAVQVIVSKHAHVRTLPCLCYVTFVIMRPRPRTKGQWWCMMLEIRLVLRTLGMLTDSFWMGDCLSACSHSLWVSLPIPLDLSALLSPLFLCLPAFNTLPSLPPPSLTHTESW